MAQTSDIRLGADIGGTFTDVVLDIRGDILSAKVLTIHAAPEQSVVEGIRIVTNQAGIRFDDLQVVIHGTTLAANALIERRGAKTALITTQGFRDVIEMRTENRFDQYDLNLQLPAPLIPRQHRYPVKGRIDAQGRELQPLDEVAIDALAEALRDAEIESIAIGFIHSYQNPSHEQCARALLAAKLPDIPISISSEVSPQMREYQRFSTVCANAYVRPLMQDYLSRLESRLRREGAGCPLYLVQSSGTLMAVDAAIEFPVRLLESGPAGGAIFAAHMASKFGLDKVVSYDMGGTTAKICLIEECKPQGSRTFEVARTHRFSKGSGMPISIPAIEMIEIGAGGGSIASVDSMRRICTGPDSAGSEPGPACYQRGGIRPAITDADLVLGKIDPHYFAGGALELSEQASVSAIDRDIADPLAMSTLDAAFGICEVVDENMANAARVHAVEGGKHISDYVMIAFGGAAPLHAARMCDKLGIGRCLIPPGAGVGSAIGFLKAPFGFEAVASRVMRLSEFSADEVNAMLGDLIDSAQGFVQERIQGKGRREITAFMRYAGQGWEIPVLLDDRKFSDGDAQQIADRFRRCYAQHFGRAVDELGNLEIEVVSWSVKVAERTNAPQQLNLLAGDLAELDASIRPVYDPSVNQSTDSRIYARDDLSAGDRVAGPAIIVERETSTVVLSGFDAALQADGSILLTSNRA